ncbi:MAG: hypothetical protein HY367_00545 [Candidatus Aenigmarchaeota archaeon]|nr:hypothetical protein [Candidatus Aenigmarchaeota archaeon]
MKAMFFILIFILLLFLIVPALVFVKPGKTDPDAYRIECVRAGGNWNECGSACTGEPPGTACTKVCVPQCECGGIAGYRCPPGYTCRLSGQVADELGRCVKQ